MGDESYSEDFFNEDTFQDGFDEGYLEGFYEGYTEGYNKALENGKNSQKRSNNADDDVNKRKKINSKKKISVKFDKPIQHIDDLIRLGEYYESNCEYDCLISIELLHKINNELKLIKSMIGLEEFKDTLTKHILFLLLGWNTDNADMRHLILYGNPGTGKTTLARLLGSIYAKIGMLDDKKFKIAKRTDFVAKYEGQTEHKTKKFLESCLGGVLFIDEAYSLSGKNSESFAKIVINTLNEFLSENGNKFICILAGYKQDIDIGILSMNPGLERRFTYRYEIKNYTPTELRKIFEKMIVESKWSIHTDALNDNYFSNLNYFKGNGGDVKTFLEKCKEIHYQRALMIAKEEWNILSNSDIKDGYNSYIKDKQLSETNNIYNSIYI